VGAGFVAGVGGGFVHHYRPLSAGEQAFVLSRQWPHLHLDDPDDYTAAEAVAAINRITSGNFRPPADSWPRSRPRALLVVILPRS
jgi:hypothetical protein